MDYDLEYGSDTMEISSACGASGRSAIIVDDLLATGGTARAAEALLQSVGAKVVVCVVVIELPAIGGREKLTAPLESIVQFDGE